jgi:hypothetical protein
LVEVAYPIEQFEPLRLAARQQSDRVVIRLAKLGPSRGVRCSSYVLPDRVLAIVLNEGPEASLACSYDLAPWVEGK